jgi:hypothetical protein
VGCCLHALVLCCLHSFGGSIGHLYACASAQILGACLYSCLWSLGLFSITPSLQAYALYACSAWILPPFCSLPRTLLLPSVFLEHCCSILLPRWVSARWGGTTPSQLLLPLYVVLYAFFSVLYVLLWRRLLEEMKRRVSGEEASVLCLVLYGVCLSL